MLMRRLSPRTDPADLAEAYAYPPHLGGPWVRANMVASADGAATWDGRSGGLGGEADRHLFSFLRGLADTIVVGAQTVRTEGYGPARPDPAWEGLRKDRPDTPSIAIVSRSLDLDFDAPIFTAAPADAPTMVLTTDNADPDRLRTARDHAEVITTGHAGIDFHAAFERLAELGHRRLLCEGGPHLLAQVAAAGMLDELCLTVSPVLAAGDAPRVLNGPALPLTVPLHLTHVIEDTDDEGFLFMRYVRKR